MKIVSNIGNGINFTKFKVNIEGFPKEKDVLEFKSGFQSCICSITSVSEKLSVCICSITTTKATDFITEDDFSNEVVIKTYNPKNWIRRGMLNIYAPQ